MQSWVERVRHAVNRGRGGVGRGSIGRARDVAHRDRILRLSMSGAIVDTVVGDASDGGMVVFGIAICHKTLEHGLRERGQVSKSHNK